MLQDRVNSVAMSGLAGVLARWLGAAGTVLAVSGCVTTAGAPVVATGSGTASSGTAPATVGSVKLRTSSPELAEPRSAVRPAQVDSRSTSKAAVHELFDLNSIALVSKELTVNRNCAAAALKIRDSQYMYAAGDCNAASLADGMAAAVATRGPLRQHVVEGLFQNGQTVPGMLYRVTFVKWDGPLRLDPKAINDLTPTGRADIAIECRDMSIVASTGSAHSSPTTVCRAGGDKTSNMTRQRWMRVLAPRNEGALEMEARRGVIVRTDTPGKAVVQYADRTEHFEGVFKATNEYDSADWVGRYAWSGSLRVSFVNSRVWYEPRGELLCVENTKACGPAYQHQAKVASKWQGSPVSRFQASDGTVFEPEKSGKEHPYLVSYGTEFPKKRPTGPQFPDGGKWLTVGDAIFILPVEGQITYPDGRKYNGRFNNGQPLF